MTPIVTLIFSWQSMEPAPPELWLIPAKSIDKQRLAGLGLSSKKGAALIKATPGHLTLPMVGLQERGKVCPSLQWVWPGAGDQKQLGTSWWGGGLRVALEDLVA